MFVIIVSTKTTNQSSGLCVQVTSVLRKLRDVNLKSKSILKNPQGNNPNKLISKNLKFESSHVFHVLFVFFML